MLTRKDIPAGSPNAWGKLDATLTELFSGKQYKLVATKFFRHPGARILAMQGLNPEVNNESYIFDLYFFFNVDEPTSKTYKVGETDWGGPLYFLTPEEREFKAESGEVAITNSVSLQKIEGGFNFIFTRLGDVRYMINGSFEIFR